jgi:hypothetical protein
MCSCRSSQEKQELAQKSHITVKQVSNWFTNARTRLWRPAYAQAVDMGTVPPHRAGAAFQFVQSLSTNMPSIVAGNQPHFVNVRLQSHLVNAGQHAVVAANGFNRICATTTAMPSAYVPPQDFTISAADKLLPSHRVEVRAKVETGMQEADQAIAALLQLSTSALY